MAGIRTAAVWVIGTATLSTPIGQTSLGNYIFTGLQTQNWVFVLFGCVSAAVLALVVDQLLALTKAGVSHAGAGWSSAAAGLACSSRALVPASRAGRRAMSSAQRPFAEQYILAALIEQQLAAGEFRRHAATASARR